MPHESASVSFAPLYYIEVSILENEIQYHMLHVHLWMSIFKVWGTNGDKEM